MRGSEWRKWNFHVHTKGTNKNDQFASPTLEEFFFNFFKKAYQHKISAIGITDYFSVERFNDTIAYWKSIHLKTDETGVKLFNDEEIEFIKSIFIFPNVELRMLPSTDRARLINIHCLFNPAYVSDLDNDFFAHIENQDKVKMNRYGITNYGKSLDPSIIGEQAHYKKGIENFVIDLKSLRELLDTNKKFRDNTILVVSNSNNDGASGLQKHYDLFENENGSLDGLRKSIYYISDAIFSANEKDIKYFLGRKSEGTDGYNDDVYKKDKENIILERGSLKPCIVGCDAHKEEDLFKRFTWVKSDLTFEGLKQILFEPEERVKIQDTQPDFKEGKLVIDEVRFISSDNTFTSEPIKLNGNLNVIIGGKSSGKSILLYNIAKTLLSDRKFFEREDIEDKYNFIEKDPHYNFEIKTGGSFTQLLHRPVEENSILPQIKYLPQNYLVKLAEPHLNKKGETLLKLTRNLIKEDPNSYSKYDEFLQRVRANDRRSDNIIDTYITLKDKVSLLEENMLSKGNKEVLEKNIQANELKVKELSEGIGMTAEEIEKYNSLQTHIQSFNTELDKINNDHKKVVAFNKEANEALNILKSKKDILSNSLETEAIKLVFNNKYKELDELLDSLIKFNSDFEIINEEVNDNTIAGKIKKPILDKQAEVNKSLEEYNKGEATRVLIQQLEKSINEDKIALQTIEQLFKEIRDNKEALIKEKEKLFSLYDENIQEYYKVIENLKPRADKLNSEGLKVTGLVKFNFPKFCKYISLVSHMGKLPQYISYIYDKDKNAIVTVDFQLLKNDLNILFDLIDKGEYPLIKNSNRKEALKTIFHDYFFDYWEVEYLNDKLGAMSTGKASFVILMLIIGLSESKAPILIDQPEDNLDNRSISRELVDYLRKKKIDRQIILVTHNANVVVNADAENIIVSNQVGQSDKISTSIYQFDYINGSIENTKPINVNETDLLKSMGIREHIADVVEGGKEAFQKREKKYSFT